MQFENKDRERERKRKSFNTLLINPRSINIISFVLVYKTVNIEQMKKTERSSNFMETYDKSQKITLIGSKVEHSGTDERTHIVTNEIVPIKEC